MDTTSIMQRPDYVKIKLPSGEKFSEVNSILRTRTLNTVCEEARCPNLTECWESGTATFMILGKNCSRGCRFCSVTHGNMEPLDPDEPRKVSEAVSSMGIKYAVITSVDRDDLVDQGSSHYAETVKLIRETGVKVECLIPDFRGERSLIRKVIEARPDVLAHNIETVRRLSPVIRDARASYDQSLSVLRYVKETYPEMITKSSIMLGHGETDKEVFEAMDDLLDARVDILTVGQYLRPSKKQLPVTEYNSMERFRNIEIVGKEKGFKFVASGPLVRTSYRAFEAWAMKNINLNQGE
ncbi:MAG: lipoyl synthase [Cuniculiplasma sp.]